MAEITTKKRILHVTECLEGGVGQAISRWIDRSDSFSNKHYALGRVRMSDRSATYSFDNEQVHSVYRLALRYVSLVREFNPDIIHVHSTKAGIIARLLPSRGAKIVYSPHCYAFLMTNYPKSVRNCLRILERILSVRTDCIVAVSPFEATIAKQISSPSCKVIIEPNIPNPSIENLVTKSKSGFGHGLVIRAVGRYCDQKNPLLMKMIVDQLTTRGLAHDFLWIGSPDDVSEVVELPISGWLSQSEVEANIESASLLLHTAAWEAAVPLVALDAIRLGTPVVMLKRPEYSGILTHGLFETEAEALDLIRGLSSPEAQNALCELQREQIDYYLKENAVGNLRRIYSQGF